MSAVYLSLLSILAVLSAGVLYYVRELARRPAPTVLHEAVIRQAVTEALAADREREINEARAFWAEQEARSAEDAPLFDSPFAAEGPFTTAGTGEDWPLFFPRPIGPLDAADNNVSMDPGFGEALRSALESLINEEGAGDGGAHPAAGTGHPSGHPGGHPADGNGEAKARREADLLATGLESGLLDVDAQAEPATAPDPRRHPSHPDFVPSQAPSREWTDTRLDMLAEDGVALTDVRPGPLGTLDVYAFADGTTLCVAPGDREAAYRLIDAVRGGEDVRLLGGSRFAGSYSLTFSTGDEPVYVLADRVVASI